MDIVSNPSTEVGNGFSHIEDLAMTCRLVYYINSFIIYAERSVNLTIANNDG